jgi:hypothetical protein
LALLLLQHLVLVLHRNLNDSLHAVSPASDIPTLLSHLKIINGVVVVVVVTAVKKTSVAASPLPAKSLAWMNSSNFFSVSGFPVFVTTFLFRLAFDRSIFAAKAAE